MPWLRDGSGSGARRDRRPGRTARAADLDAADYQPAPLRWSALCGWGRPVFVPADESPDCSPLLVGGNGVSGTTAISAIGANSLNLANH